MLGFAQEGSLHMTNARRFVSDVSMHTTTKREANVLSVMFPKDSATKRERPRIPGVRLRPQRT
jgi:hypothetical protein